MNTETKMVSVNLINDINLIDFQPSKFVDDEEEIYSLSIIAVQDEPRTINIITTNTVTMSLNEMSEVIQTLLETGMFDGNTIMMKTNMHVYANEGDDYSTEEFNWEDCGLVVK